MRASRSPQIVLVLILALLPAGCGWYYMFTSPPIPDMPPMPSEADIERMQQRMMGKAPAKPAPVTTDGVEVVFQTGHAGGIHALALSPNGRYIASSGSHDGSVKIWDVASGQEIRNFAGFGMLGADLLAFSEDSKQVVTHEYGGAIKLYEVASGREVRSVGSILDRGGAISGNGRFVVAGEKGDSKAGFGRIAGGSRSLAVIDLMTGQTIWTLPDSEVQSPLAISRDGRIIVTSKTDTEMPNQGGVIGTIGSTIGSIMGLDSLFTSDAPPIPTFKQELLVWEVPAKKLQRKLPYAAASDGINGTLSPDGRFLVTEQYTERALRVLDLETGKLAPPISMAHAGMKGMGMTNALTFSPDGKLLVVAKQDGLAKVMEFPSGRDVKQLEAGSLNFSQQGDILIVAPVNGGAPYLQDLSTGKETHLAGGASEVSDLALTADGRSVVAGMAGGSAKLWDLAAGQLVRTFNCPDGMAVTSVSLSPTSPLLATGCVNGSAWLWDVGTGKQLRNLSPPLPPDHFAPLMLRIARDGHNIVIGQGNQLILRDLSSGKELRRITLPHESMPQVFRGMDDLSDASEGLDPKTRAMLEKQAANQSAIDPQMKERMEEGMQWIHALAVHPNGRLAAIGRSYSTSLWDLQTGQQVLTFQDKGRIQAKARQQRMREEQQRQAMEEENSLSSLLPSLPFGLGSSAASSSRSTQMVVMDDPMDLIEDLNDEHHGARSLAFSPDGKFLLTDGVTGKTIWDVATGHKVRVPKTVSRQPGFDPMSFMNRMELNVHGMGVAFSPDGRLAARGAGEVIKLWDSVTGQERGEFIGHTSAVKTLVFSHDGRLLISGGGDGAVRVWNLQTGKELAALIGVGREDFVTVTPDQYYRASKASIKGVAFRVKKELYPFEQFDLRFNRPDIVLARLGMASPAVVQSYRAAYERRLKKMGMSEQRLGADFHLPKVELLTADVPVIVTSSTLSLRVRVSDDKYPLDRLHVFLNDVPLYGTKGIPLPSKQLQAHEQEIQVPLVPGRNKIQVSVLNQQGVESLMETVYTTSTAKMAPPEVYVVGIGVSDYKDKAYNLRYAAKDAMDLLATYRAVEQRPTASSKVHTLDLTNQKATKTEIIKARDWLKQSKINDLVVVFAAGHGMTDEKSDYYFGTHDIDPKHPAINGLPYQEFENLLDGIPALQKVLLLDTCFSGEIDKDQAVVVPQSDQGGARAGTVKMRAFKAARGVTVTTEAETESAGPASGPRLSSEMLGFQQDWFADLRRGTGAAVISSSSGNEYSLEGEQWKNGVFTYSLLNGLKNHEADANKDQVITVSELQTYVIEQVRKLTQGGQNPTVRRENLEYDFAVY